MKGKLKIISLMIFSVISLSGCGSSDLNRTVFVSSAGISLGEGIYSVSLTGNAAASEETEEITAKGMGRTPAEALEKARKNCGYELFFGHCTAVAADADAMRDTALLSFFTDSAVSPACRVYYSDSPEAAAGDIISAQGFTAEIYEIAACRFNGTPAVVPCADDPECAAIITARDTVRLNRDDSFGIMLLRNDAYPKLITAETDGGVITVKASPKTKRHASYSGGELIFTADISLNIESISEKDRRSVCESIAQLCADAFDKTASGMGIDAVELYKLIGYTPPTLENARVLVRVR